MALIGFPIDNNLAYSKVCVRECVRVGFDQKCLSF